MGEGKGTCKLHSRTENSFFTKLHVDVTKSGWVKSRTDLILSLVLTYDETVTDVCFFSGRETFRRRKKVNFFTHFNIFHWVLKQKTGRKNEGNFVILQLEIN